MKLTTDVSGLTVAEIKEQITSLEQEKANFLKELKTKGDIHLANIFRFFAKWVDKKDPLRDAIKGIVFGCIYGKSVGTLGRDIWTQRLNEAKDKVFSVKSTLADTEKLEAMAKDQGKDISVVRAELQDKLTQANVLVAEIQADKTQCKGVAQEIVDKMVQEWVCLYGWMNDMHVSAEKQLYVEAPHGRRRHLYGMLVPRNDVQAALKRRAVNAPVQGFGADVGHTAARILDIEIHRFLRKFKLIDPVSPYVTGTVECAVHDALLMTVPYKLVLPYLQIKHWAMTVGVAQWFNDYYGDAWLVPPEIETEIGAHEAAMGAWDFTQDGIAKIIKESVEEQVRLGLVASDAMDSIVSQVMTVPSEWADYLNERYPWFSTPNYEKSQPC